MTLTLGSWPCFVKQHWSHCPSVVLVPVILHAKWTLPDILLKKIIKLCFKLKMVSFVTAFLVCLCFGFTWELQFEESTISALSPRIKLRSTIHLARNFIFIISRAELQKSLDNLQRNSDSPAHRCEAHFWTLRFATSVWQARLFVD